MAAKSRTMAQQKTKEAYCFIVPAFIYMILVLGYPIVYNIILSLKDVNVKNLKSGTSVFVGLQNYISSGSAQYIYFYNSLSYFPVYHRICICDVFQSEI